MKVLDNNHDFNYNQKNDKLGSCLMKAMLGEVSRFLENDHTKNWVESNYHQLIYDFTNGQPEFRLICTSPDLLDKSTREEYEELDLPGFHIPSTNDLCLPITLHRYLSQALHVPLNDKTQMLDCVSENNFVLTLDFLMKILSTHERVSCKIPCIMEGETGASFHEISSNAHLIYF